MTAWTVNRSEWRPVGALLLAALLLWSLPGQAEEAVPAETGLLPQILRDVDSSRDYLSAQLVGFAKEVDGFFGGESNFQETNDSVAQLYFVRQVEKGGVRQNVVTGRVKVHLPTTEQRLHLLVESDPDKATVTPEGQPALSAAPTAPESYSLALRYQKSREDERIWHASADAGLRFQGVKLNPFVRARASFSLPVGEWRMKLAESVFWFNSTGAGESTQLDLEHFWSESVLFRSTTLATWLHDHQRFDASQSFTSYHTLDEKRALRYQLAAVGVSRPQWQVTDYVLLMSYRQRLHRQWMYFEMSPQLHFQRERDYRGRPMFLVQLELLFDGSR